MEQRKLNVSFSKSGGTAGKGGITTKINIPKKWLDIMEVTQENRRVLVTFENGKITIEKSPED